MSATEQSLRDKFAAQDREFLDWCRQTAAALPASAGFYNWLGDDVEKRVREYEQARRVVA